MEYSSIEELIELAEKRRLPVSEIVIRAEMKESEKDREELEEEMLNKLRVMKDAVQNGVKGDVVSASGLTGGDAYRLDQKTEVPGASLYHRLIIYALATAEVNAGMGKIVAGPTAGSAGIIPGVVLALGEELRLDDRKLVYSLFTAAGLGEIVARKATLSGAAGGCQAECGVASAMAAGAAVELAGGSAQMVGHAFALALKNLLGLSCDPVAGLVEIPCVKRNAFGASHALTAATMALGGVRSLIPVDEVLMAMYQTGKLLPSVLKETSRAGLAITPTACRIGEKLSEHWENGG